MITVSAPGKLFLSGEWAILEGYKGVVAAVDKRVYAEIGEAENISVSLDDFGVQDLKVSFENGKIVVGDLGEKTRYLVFVKAALEAALTFLGEYRPFKLRTWGNQTSIILDGVQRKVGFGSSAASTVAVVGSVLKFHGWDIEKNKDLVYKLSVVAHFFAQGKAGSGYDVAASAFGGIFVYRKFDPEWLESQLISKPLKNVVIGKWPGFIFERLEDLDGLQLVVCWTGEPASTVAMMSQMEKFKRSEPENYGEIYRKIGDVVDKVIDSWKKKDKEAVLYWLKQNQIALSELTEKSGVNIETELFREIGEAADRSGCIGKVSGAGGGDCGIVVCFDKAKAAKARRDLKKRFHMIKTKVDYQGVK